MTTIDPTTTLCDLLRVIAANPTTSTATGRIALRLECAAHATLSASQALSDGSPEQAWAHLRAADADLAEAMQLGLDDDGDGDDPVLTEEDYEILADLEERLDAIEATLLELPDPALLEQTLRALDELCRDLRGDLTREQADLVLERVGYAITYRAAVSPRADRYPHLDQWLRTVPVLRLHEVWAHAVAAAPRRVQARVAAAPSWIQRALAAGDDAALLRRYDALSPLAAGCTVASLRRVVPVFTGPWWAHRLDRPRPAR